MTSASSVGQLDLHTRRTNRILPKNGDNTTAGLPVAQPGAVPAYQEMNLCDPIVAVITF